MPIRLCFSGEFRENQQLFMEEKADLTQARVQAAMAEPCCRVPGVESRTFRPWEGPQQVRRMQLPWVLSGLPTLVLQRF